MHLMISDNYAFKFSKFPILLYLTDINCQLLSPRVHCLMTFSSVHWLVYLTSNVVLEQAHSSPATCAELRMAVRATEVYYFSFIFH